MPWANENTTLGRIRLEIRETDNMLHTFKEQVSNSMKMMAEEIAELKKTKSDKRKAPKKVTPKKVAAKKKK